jgi:hypothetical protein
MLGQIAAGILACFSIKLYDAARRKPPEDETTIRVPHDEIYDTVSMPRLRMRG